MCAYSQDSVSKKYYAAAALRLNIKANVLPVGAEAALNFGLSRRIYLGVNLSMDRVIKKTSIDFGSVGYAIPPGGRGLLSFYAIGADVQYKLAVAENSLVISCTNGIEIIENGYRGKRGNSGGGYSITGTNYLALVRPGVRYYYGDKIGIGVQYSFLAGHANFGEPRNFSRLQLIVALKTSQ